MELTATAIVNTLPESGVLFHSRVAPGREKEKASLSINKSIFRALKVYLRPGLPDWGVLSGNRLADYCDYFDWPDQDYGDCVTGIYPELVFFRADQSPRLAI